MKSFPFAPLALAAAIALTALQTAAFAGTPVPNGRTERVETADLNLATPEGQATLDRRIAGAVRRVCATPDTRNAHSVNDSRACEALASEMARVLRDQKVAAAVAGQTRVAQAPAAPAVN